MSHALVARDAPNSVALRPNVRPQHLVYVQSLVDYGRMCGQVGTTPVVQVQP